MTDNFCSNFLSNRSFPPNCVIPAAPDLSFKPQDWFQPAWRDFLTLWETLKNAYLKQTRPFWLHCSLWVELDLSIGHIRCYTISRADIKAFIDAQRKERTSDDKKSPPLFHITAFPKSHCYYADHDKEITKNHFTQKANEPQDPLPPRADVLYFLCLWPPNSEPTFVGPITLSFESVLPPETSHLPSVPPFIHLRLSLSSRLCSNAKL